MFFYDELESVEDRKLIQDIFIMKIMQWLRSNLFGVFSTVYYIKVLRCVYNEMFIWGTTFLQLSEERLSTIKLQSS